MSHGDVQIIRLTVLTEDIKPLVVEAEQGGHRFMRRLYDEWNSGQNRFDGPGELFLGAFAGGRLVGVGGLNRDPYADDDQIGRLRHVYVLAAARRLRVGTLLVNKIISEAEKHFVVVRLRTITPEAATFYERLGFEKTSEEAATHRIVCSVARAMGISTI
jgi:GNAT superfamily N-acetyltransferase